MVNSQPIETAQRNQLLAGLSQATLTRLVRDLDLRSLRVRDKVVERGAPVDGVFFPLNCILSVVAEGAAGEVVEVATIGREGMAGLSVYLGVSTTATLETFAQVPGEALWLRAREFREHLAAETRLGEIMGSYTQALMTQISQASACNRIHSAEERCARWLLMTHDRVDSDRFELTHEFLGQMIGMRRATVSAIASALQAEGLIRYARGIITILDRPKLEDHSCECYRIIRDEYTRLLGPFKQP